MRARLVDVWPDLSHLFHLKPQDIYELTAPELQSYLDALERYAEAIEDARR